MKKLTLIHALKIGKITLSPSKKDDWVEFVFMQKVDA
jgi:hypothetical protein